MSRIVQVVVGILLGVSTAFAQPAPPATAPAAPAAPPAAAPAPAAAPVAPPEAPVAPPAAAPAPPAPPSEPVPAPSEPVVAAPPPVEPPAAEPLAAEEPPPPKKLTVGTDGLFQPGVLLQAWFLVDRADETTSTFRMRRAEISVKGEIIPKLVSYAVMLDPAKVLEFRDTTLEVDNQDPAPSDPDVPESVTAKQPASAVSVFQDLFITLQSEYVDASIGQFKIPVSWEGYNSSSKLLFAERAAVAREFGDKRDMGIRLAKTFEYFGYSAGVFNGTTLNNLDGNNAKDVALRLEGYPVEGLVIAGVVYTSVGDRGEPGTKDRFEGDLRFEHGPFLVQAEYIRAHDVGSSGPVDGHGVYGALAYTLIKVLQPALRVGYLDQNVDQNLDPASGGRDELVQVDVGLNYLLRKHEAKFQLNYSRFEYDERTPNNEVLLAAQVAF
jgi:hypothetical protein